MPRTISGLENIKVMESDLNTSLSKRVHNFPTETFAIRIRTELDPVARALEDSPNLVWS